RCRAGRLRPPRDHHHPAAARCRAVGELHRRPTGDAAELPPGASRRALPGIGGPAEPTGTWRSPCPARPARPTIACGRAASARGGTMQAADAIVEILKREGVSTLFCYPTTSLIETAVAAGLRPIICRQERVGVDMADGYTRVTNGKPVGVFAMQYGPGAENAFPGIATAFSDSAPVLFLPLGHAREAAQLYPMFKSTRSYASITKSVEDIVLPEHVPGVMRRAFSALKNGRLGPVMVEMPRDVVDLDIGTAALDYAPIRPTRSAPDPSDVEAAARVLIDASCPIILAGQGVLYAEASDA